MSSLLITTTCTIAREHHYC